ncbi:Glutathione S-transferase class-mu 26 kDa like protein [Argiope bruennichi]|uniref:glutathione transferase n=1 Tax=Argiope bruennichi TaxID=94029 RepID=A0A8T0EVB6_ARGBR|nr:Glutathione S-transferase class-mu 26 kDa like protein [Argiope bruennichi]
MFKCCRKADLRLIAKELGLNISDEMTVLELIDMIKKSDKFKTEPKTKENDRSRGYLSPDELRQAELSLVSLAQQTRKYDLEGKDDEQKLRVSLVEQQMTDLHYALVLLVYRSDYDEKVKAEFIQNIPNLLKPWEKYIGENKYLTGDSITYVDFMAYDVFDFYRLFHKEALDDFPKIKAFQERMKNLPELQEYMNSSTYQNRRWPIFGPTAKDCGGGDPPEHL